VAALIATRSKEFASLLSALSGDPLFFKGKRVMTLAHIAQLLGVSLRQVQQAWRRLRDKKREDGSPRAREGRHFFKIEGQDLKDFNTLLEERAKSDRSSLPPSKFANSLTLVTEHGFARLVASSFQSNEIAEDLRDEVVDGYFRGKEQAALAPAGREGLSASILATYALIDGIAANERKAEANKLAIEATNDRLAALEEGTTLKLGELTAVQMAQRVGWESRSGAPHNLAVILAAQNHDFVARGLLVKRVEEGPSAFGVAHVHVFTPEGAEEFELEVAPLYTSAVDFAIRPNALARKNGQRCKRNVLGVSK